MNQDEVTEQLKVINSKAAAHGFKIAPFSPPFPTLRKAAAKKKRPTSL